ncbi:hypothetical protein MMPV_004496 [Pyropia vietnamensis]
MGLVAVGIPVAVRSAVTVPPTTADRDTPTVKGADLDATIHAAATAATPHQAAWAVTYAAALGTPAEANAVTSYVSSGGLTADAAAMCGTLGLAVGMDGTVSALPGGGGRGGWWGGPGIGSGDGARDSNSGGGSGSVVAVTAGAVVAAAVVVMVGVAIIAIRRKSQARSHGDDDTEDRVADASGAAERGVATARGDRARGSDRGSTTTHGSGTTRSTTTTRDTTTTTRDSSSAAGSRPRSSSGTDTDPPLSALGTPRGGTTRTAAAASYPDAADVATTTADVPHKPRWGPPDVPPVPPDGWSSPTLGSRGGDAMNRPQWALTPDGGPTWAATTAAAGLPGMVPVAVLAAARSSPAPAGTGSAPANSANRASIDSAISGATVSAASDMDEPEAKSPWSWPALVRPGSGSSSGSAVRRPSLGV